MKKLILASNSPRRRELLAGLDLPFEVRVVPGISEHYPPDMAPDRVPVHLAETKAHAYEAAPDEVIITADTVVILHDQILGKPHDDHEARLMLQQLSGETHRVVTGVCLKSTSLQRSFAVTSHVTFKTLSSKEIDYYVSHYHPTDKAGAYGIQEWIGHIGVSALQGSYFNVMGLPVQRIYDELSRHFDVHI